MYQYKLKKETREFLTKYVYPRSKFFVITDENADMIVEFIEDNFIVPLTNDLDNNLPIDKKLLKDAEDAVDDICEN